MASECCCCHGIAKLVAALNGGDAAARNERIVRNVSRIRDSSVSRILGRLAFRKDSLTACEDGTLAQEGDCRPPTTKKFQQYSHVLEEVDFCQQVLHDARSQIAGLLIGNVYSKGDYVFRKGDKVEHYMVLYDGDVVFEECKNGYSRASGDSAKGLTAELGASPVSHDILHDVSCRILSEKAWILSLKRSAFLQLVRQQGGQGKEMIKLEGIRDGLREAWQKLQESYREVMAQAEIYQLMPDSARCFLAPRLHRIQFSKGEYIFKVGDEGDHSYILIEGEVKILNQCGQEVSRFFANEGLASAPTFGARAIRYGVFRETSVQVESEHASVLCCDREHFQMVEKSEHLRPRLESHPVSPSEPVFNAPSTSELDSHRCFQYTHYRFEDLEEVKFLASGSYGYVTVVKHVPSEQKFALKVLSKGFVKDVQVMRFVMNERNILKSCALNPWVVRLLACFNREEYVYFLTELVQGGELMEVYEKADLIGRDEHARFHAACIVRGLCMLHSRQLMHRDIKPENVLLDNRGYCKIADFGFAKLVIGKTVTPGFGNSRRHLPGRAYTHCGTAQYMAPEQLMPGCREVGYTAAVDWWALGIIIYEMMVGLSPFDTEQNEHVFSNIREGIESITFPSRVQIRTYGHRQPRQLDPQGPWSDIVRQLCVRQPDQRLTMRKHGVVNIEDHTWYGAHGDLPEFDWRSHNMCVMRAPYVPAVQMYADSPKVDTPEEKDAKNALYRPNRIGYCSCWGKDQWKDFADEWGPASVNSME